jgi:hypothetical protein
MSIDTEYAVKKDIRNNPLMREIDTRHRGELRRYLMLVALSVLVLLASAWQRQRVQALASEVETLKMQQALELENNRKLRLNQEMFNSPPLIERGALDLGLHRPSLAETMVIERAPESSPASGVVAQAR